MAYVDSLLNVSTEHAVTGDAVSENSVSLSVAKDLTFGEQLYLVVVIDTDFDSSGDATSMNVQVVTSANADLSSHTVQTQTGEIEEADLTANRAKIVLPVAMPDGIEELYLGARYEIGSEENFTSGALTAYFTMDP